jgi:ComF family protein
VNGSSLTETARAIGSGLLDLLYPPICLLCRRPNEEALCAVCRSEARPLLPPFCDRCGAPIPAGRLVCERCEMGPDPAYAWSVAVCEYSGAIRQSIHVMKYHRRSALGRPLGEMLAGYLRGAGPPLIPEECNDVSTAFDLIVPVPLHPAHLRRRTFNQAERIALPVAESFGWQIDAAGVRRVSGTRTQTRLDPVARSENVRGVFAAEPHRFDGRSVLIIDDVLTTTSTAREVARVVRDAGARRICVAAVARSI